jgi:hypothetical protein
MEVVHRRCAGIDVAKKGATVCVRIGGSGSRRTQATVTSWGSMTNQILALREHLGAEQVSCVVMEATGDYWKPYYWTRWSAARRLQAGSCSCSAAGFGAWSPTRSRYRATLSPRCAPAPGEMSGSAR